VARTLVDTSAFVALVDEADASHAPAVEWLATIDPGEILMAHNYVVVETAALLHRRLGPSATRDFLEDMVPQVSLLFVDEGLHRAAVSAYLAAIRRRSSLVDWVSFEVMRELAVERAFTFDRAFARQGFETVP